MIRKQITIFLQNEITRLLGENNINISAMSIAEASEFGVVRMILDDYEKALKILVENNFSANLVDVLCFEIPDTPGSLHEALKSLADASVNVSYMYGYSNHGIAPMIMKVSDIQKAVAVLKNYKEYMLYSFD